MRVPYDLQGIFQRRTIKKALRTNDFKTALSSVKLVSNRFDSIIKVIRSGMLTQKEMDRIIKNFFTSHLEFSDFLNLKSKPKTQTEKDDLLKKCDEWLEKYQKYLDENAFDIMDGLLKRFLAKSNITVNEDSYDMLYLKRGFLMALVEATRLDKARIQGNLNNWYDDFRGNLKPHGTYIHVEQVSSKEAEKVRLLSQVIDEYTTEKIQKKEWNDKNREETLMFYKQLVEFLGDKNIRDYERPELVTYQGLLQKFPANIRKNRELRNLSIAEIITLIENDDLPSCRIISTKTVNKNLIRVNAVFDYAQKMGYRPTNPAFGLKISDKGHRQSEEKDAYNKEDIESLLHSPVYKKVKIERPERFWIPLIGLYSGLRLGEICQLYKADIKEDFDIPYFDINQDTEDKSLKTISSKRLVPIHPVLMELGLLSYFKSVKNERLWHNLKKRRDGYGHDFSKWYNNFEKKYITDHPKKSFHSLRHTFIDTLKQTIVNDKAYGLEKVLSETVGHLDDSITMSRYGKEILLKTKLDLIKRLDYGIDLSHLKFPLKKK